MPDEEDVRYWLDEYNEGKTEEQEGASRRSQAESELEDLGINPETGEEE